MNALAPKATPIPPTVTSAPPLSRLRWLMIGFAFLATVINYLDRQALSVVAPILTKEFNMSNEAYGYVVSAFMLAYAISNGISGPMIDRLRTRLGYALCMLVWSTAGMLHALATGAVSLASFRFLLGIGEAGNWPAALKITAEWFPVRERALACGIFNSGAAIGAIIAPPLMAWLVVSFGWQAAFVIVGLTGYAWVVGWWVIYRTPVHVQAEVNEPPPSAWRMLRTRFVSVLMISKIFLDPVWYFYIFWFPKYLSSVHHFDLIQIGKTAWIPFVTADIGNIVGGWMTGRLIHHGWPTNPARKSVTAIFAILMMSGLGVPFTASPWTAITLISIATFGYTGYNTNTLAFPADVFPRNMVASAWGLASMGAGIGGMIFNPVGGKLVDLYGYTPVFIGYSLLPVIALSLIVFVIGPLKPHPDFVRAGKS